MGWQAGFGEKAQLLAEGEFEIGGRFPVSAEQITKPLYRHLLFSSRQRPSAGDSIISQICRMHCSLLPPGGVPDPVKARIQ